MASGLTIGANIKLDGEKEYKQSLSECNAAIKMFDAQLKAVSAELKNTGDTMEGSAKQAGILEQKMLEQSAKVKVLEDALASATEKYGEYDKRTMAYATSLAKEQAAFEVTAAAVADLEEKMSPLGQSMAKNTESAEEAAQNIQLLESELKVLDAQYANSTDSADYLSQKQELLSKASQEAENKVEALSKALQDSAELTGKNSTEYAALEKELNSAKAEMYEAKNAADEFGEESATLSEKIDKLAEAFGAKLPDNIKNLIDSFTGAKKGGEEASDSMLELGGSMGEASGSAGGFSEALSGVIGGDTAGILGVAAAAALAVAAVVAIVAALDQLANSSAAEYEEALDSIRARTGEVTEANEKMLRELNNEALGDGYANIADAIAEVKANIQGIDEVSLEKITRGALILEDTFGSGVNETVRASSALMINFGAESGKALDAIAAGFQNGLDKGKDFGDTIVEYSTDFSALGMSIEDMLNILSNGLENGVRNTDDIADAWREFGIRVKEMDDDTASALASLGIGAEETQEAFNQGGEAARNAALTIVQALDETDNKVQQNADGVALFGTKWEDTAGQAVLGLTDTKAAIDDVNGALEDSKIESFSKSWESLKNTVAGILDEAMQPLLEILTPIIDSVQSIFSVLGEIVRLATELFNLVIGSAVSEILKGVSELIGGIASGLSSVISVLTEIFAAINDASGGIFGILGEILSLLGAFIELGLTFLSEVLTPIKEKVEELLSPFVEFTDSAKSGISGLTEEVRAMSESMRSSGETVEETTATTIESISQVGDAAEEASGKTISAAQEAGSAVQEVAVGTQTLYRDTAGLLHSSQKEALDAIAKANEETAAATRTFWVDGVKETEKAVAEYTTYYKDSMGKLHDSAEEAAKATEDAMAKGFKNSQKEAKSFGDYVKDLFASISSLASGTSFSSVSGASGGSVRSFAMPATTGMSSDGSAMASLESNMAAFSGAANRKFDISAAVNATTSKLVAATNLISKAEGKSAAVEQREQILYEGDNFSFESGAIVIQAKDLKEQEDITALIRAFAKSKQQKRKG